MRITIKQLEGALLLIKQYCIDKGCENCALFSGDCDLKPIPGNWIIKKEGRKIIL